MAIITNFIWDVPFGQKGRALEIAKRYDPAYREAGFPPSRFLVGSIGAPESRIIEQAEWESLAALEAAWAALDDPRMSECQRELAPYVVPGSHRWEIYRIHQP